MPRVEVEPGVRLHVEDRGDGPPVLLLHGWSLGAEAWERQLGVLSAAGHRAMAIDLRGHGDSDAPDQGYAIERLAGDVAAVLEALDLHDTIVVGWSLGGLVAARTALDHPARIAGLVLVAAGGGAAARTAAYPYGVRADDAEPALLAAEHADRAAARRAAVELCFPVDAVPPTALVDRLVDLSLRTPTAAADACLRTLLRTDQTLELPALAVPVTHILGTRDPSVSVRGIRATAAALGSRLVELDCGHYPMFELPEAFDAALLAAVADPRPAVPEGTPA